MAFKKKTKNSEDESSKKSSANNLNIEDTLAAIKTKFGDEAIMKLGQKPKVNINAIPTGSIGLDAALGIGGVPRGRIIEIFGPESSGKTTLALHIIAEAQKKGGICAFIDAEHAMDPEYSKKIGVQIDDLLYLNLTPVNKLSKLSSKWFVLENSTLLLLTLLLPLLQRMKSRAIWVPHMLVNRLVLCHRPSENLPPL